MYVFMHVWMYVYVYGGMYVCMHVHRGRTFCVCLHVFTNPRMQRICMYVRRFANFWRRRGNGTPEHPFASDLSLTPLHPILAKHTSYLVMSSIITSTYGHTRYAYKDMCKHFIDVFCRCTKTCLLICWSPAFIIRIVVVVHVSNDVTFSFVATSRGNTNRGNPGHWKTMLFSVTKFSQSML